MGLNKIYLGFRYLFYPRYYVAINRRVIEQSSAAISQLNCINFLRDLGSDVNPLQESALTYFIQSRPEPVFHKDLSQGFFEGYTVTFAALQIAFYMGFSQVLIVGMDHRYSYSGTPNESHALKGPDPNHFDSSYLANKLGTIQI